MASLLEPPALLTVGIVLAATAGALYAGLRRPVPNQPIEVTGENDEAWGADDPPRASKRPYVYPPEPVAVDITTIDLPEPPVESLRDPGSTRTERPLDGELTVQNADQVQELEEEEEEEVSLADLMRARPDAREDR